MVICSKFVISILFYIGTFYRINGQSPDDTLLERLINATKINIDNIGDLKNPTGLNRENNPLNNNLDSQKVIEFLREKFNTDKTIETVTHTTTSPSPSPSYSISDHYDIYSSAVMVDAFFIQPTGKVASQSGLLNLQSCQFFCENAQQMNLVTFMSFGGTSGMYAGMCNCYKEIPYNFTPTVSRGSGAASYVLTTLNYALQPPLTNSAQRYLRALPGIDYESAFIFAPTADVCQSSCLVISWFRGLVNGIFSWSPPTTTDCEANKITGPSQAVTIPVVNLPLNCKCYFVTPNAMPVPLAGAKFGLAMEAAIVVPSSVNNTLETLNRRLSQVEGSLKSGNPILNNSSSCNSIDCCANKIFLSSVMSNNNSNIICQAPWCQNNTFCKTACTMIQPDFTPNTLRETEGSLDNTQPLDFIQNSDIKMDIAPNGNLFYNTIQNAEEEAMSIEKKILWESVRFWRCSTCVQSKCLNGLACQLLCHGC